MGVFPTEALAQLAAPTGLTVTSGDQSLIVSWDEVANTSLRNIDYTSSTSVGDNDFIRPSREGPEKGWVAANAGSGPSSFTITGLTNGTTYRVRVRLWITGSGLTPYAWATGMPAAPPTAPRNVKIVPGDDSVTLTWEAPSSWGTWSETGSFAITEYYTSASGGASFFASSDVTSSTIERDFGDPDNKFPYAENGQTGDWGIRAFTQKPGSVSDSDVLFGPEVKVTVTVGVPAVTTGLSVTPGTSSLALSWTAPAQNGGAITGYDVHYTSSTTVEADADASGNDPSAAWVAASHSGTTASGSITGLSANTTYRVRVRAKNEHGSGAWSAPQSGTTPPPTPVVEFQPAAFVSDEGLNISVSLSVNPAPSSSITVAVGHTAGTATTGNTCAADADYVRPPASVTVAAGATSQNIPISLCADALVENNETFTLTLNAGTGYTVGATSSATVTIRDATLTVNLSASPNPVNEGTSVTVTAMRSGQGPAVTIPVTVTAVTAESGDYGTLTGIPLTAGATTGTATITTAKDADANDETFTVALNTATLPLPHAAGTSSSVTITITDPDLPDIPVRLSVSPNPVQAGGTVTVTATLSSAARSHVSIPITLSPGTAEAGDYGSLSSISIANGATKGTGTIPTTEDADTSNETFTVALGSSLPSGITAGSPSSVEVTIQNRSNLTASLSAAPNPVQEGGAVTITVALSETQTNPVTIPLTVTPGTAESGDFDDASPVNVTITAGQTEAEYRITTYEDGDSHDETFTVALDAANLPTEVGLNFPPNFLPIGFY